MDSFNHLLYLFILFIPSVLSTDVGGSITYAFAAAGCDGP